MQEQTQPTQGQAGQQPGSQVTGQGSQSMQQPPQQVGQVGGQQLGETAQMSQGGMGQQTSPSGLGQTSPGGMGQQTSSGGMGQQMEQGSTGQGTGLSLQDVETAEQRAAVDDISWAIQVCGWCADQCIQAADPNMIECIRLCEDVTELGETALALIPRNSRCLQPVLRAFEQAAQACAQECGQHQHAHCQECAQVLPQAAQSVQQFIASRSQQQPGF